MSTSPLFLTSRFAQVMAMTEATLLDGTCKGMPPTLSDLRVDEIGQQEWNMLAQDLPFPVAVLKSSAIEANRGWMRAFLQHTGAVIAPHVKTTMSPQLFGMQIEDGAWALTVASANQLAVLHKFGVQRVLVANQLVGPQSIAILFEELSRYDAADVIVTIDSQQGLDELRVGMKGRRIVRSLGILLAIGVQGGRSGIRNVSEAMNLARMIVATPGLTLRGLESYENPLTGLTDDERRLRTEIMLQLMTDVADACQTENLFPADEVILSSGASEFFDIVVDRLGKWEKHQHAQVVIRSGCYIVHDHLACARAFERLKRRHPEYSQLPASLSPALEVWGIVQSLPEAGKAIVSVGKRDISYDFDLPAALYHYRPGRDTTPEELYSTWPVLRLNDHHAFLRIPANADIAVGDLIGFGISHPCTTLDKWRVIPVVDDNYNVDSAIQTFF
jgi:D-serine dehydratase